jgi:hypothetical protein
MCRSESLLSVKVDYKSYRSTSFIALNIMKGTVCLMELYRDVETSPLIQNYVSCPICPHRISDLKQSNYTTPCCVRISCSHVR